MLESWSGCFVIYEGVETSLITQNKIYVVVTDHLNRSVYPLGIVRNDNNVGWFKRETWRRVSEKEAIIITMRNEITDVRI